MLTNSLDLTIAVPCKNEEKNIVGTLDTIVSAVSEVGCSCEIIVIDDGSTDKTSELVELYQRGHPSLPIRLYKNSRNLGLSQTYVNGAFLGRGKYYRFVGGDNAEPKEAMVQILKMMGKADIIIPFHKQLTGKSTVRIAISKFYTFLVNLFSGYSIRYYNGCAIHLRYNVLRWHSYAYGFGFQADMITLLLQQGATYLEIPVRVGHTNKGRGASPFHMRNFVSTGHTLFEIWRRRINVLLFDAPIANNSLSYSSSRFVPLDPPELASSEGPKSWNNRGTTLSKAPESTTAQWGGLSRIRVLWAYALGVSVLISVIAIFRGGYVGPDYDTHLARILNAKRFFDFSLADPPIYVLLGHGLFRLIGRNNAFPITLSILQVAINTLALWWFFLYSERRFKSPLLHLAFVVFLTFLPVRIIHTVSVGTDWMMIPVFVLLLFLFEKFLSENTSTPKNAAFLGLAMALGIWSKYNFMALIPAVFVIFAVLGWKRRWKLKRFVTICALSLVLPSAVLLYSYWASTRVKNAVAKVMWLPKGEAPDFNCKDLFLVKTNDLQLFSAPEMFGHEPFDIHNYYLGYRVAHQHSFLALSHMGTFTDTQNLFQDLAGRQSVDRLMIASMKTRRPWKTSAMVWSMSLGTVWTVLALIGTPWICFGAVKHLWRDKLEREDVAALLGSAFFLLMFLLVPFLYLSARTASWSPRLYLVPLLFFFWAGFLLLDRTIAAKYEKFAYDVLTLVIVQSGIEIVMLT